MMLEQDIREEEKIGIITPQNNIIDKRTKKISEIKEHREQAAEIVDDLISEGMIRCAATFSTFLYAFISLACTAIFIVYCLDYFIADFSAKFMDTNNLFLWIPIGLCAIGAVVGMYGTFKYGSVDEQMQSLDVENDKLKDILSDLSQDTDDLQLSVNAFQKDVDEVMDSNNDLTAQIKAFRKLENALTVESKSQNAEIAQFLADVSKLFCEFKALQIQVEKTNLLGLFYELEFRDDGDAQGLNQSEYEMFLNRLDNKTAAKFTKTFADMDHNGDGTIDLKEFQSEIDFVYEKIDVGIKNQKKRKKNKSGKGRWDKFLK